MSEDQAELTSYSTIQNGVQEERPEKTKFDHFSVRQLSEIAASSDQTFSFFIEFFCASLNKTDSDALQFLM